MIDLEKSQVKPERGSSTTEDQLALPQPKLAHEHSKTASLLVPKP